MLSDAWWYIGRPVVMRCRRTRCVDTRSDLRAALERIEILKAELAEAQRCREADQDRFSEELGSLQRSIEGVG